MRQREFLFSPTFLFNDSAAEQSVTKCAVYMNFEKKTSTYQLALLGEKVPTEESLRLSHPILQHKLWHL